jgi:hypothetical protein
MENKKDPKEAMNERIYDSMPMSLRVSTIPKPEICKDGSAHKWDGAWVNEKDENGKLIGGGVSCSKCRMPLSQMMPWW